MYWPNISIFGMSDNFIMKTISYNKPQTYNGFKYINIFETQDVFLTAIVEQLQWSSRDPFKHFIFNLDSYNDWISLQI